MWQSLNCIFSSAVPAECVWTLTAVCPPRLLSQLIQITSTLLWNGGSRGSLFLPNANVKSSNRPHTHTHTHYLFSFFLKPFFPLSILNHLARAQRGTSGREGESHEADSSTRSRQTRCASLRGQSPLFQDLTDKRQAGNPTIEAEWL